MIDAVLTCLFPSILSNGDRRIKLRVFPESFCFTKYMCTCTSYHCFFCQLHSVLGERCQASKMPKRIEACRLRLLTLFALYCAVAVSGATFRSADEQLEEEKRVAEFLEKPDYFLGDVKLIDWRREQDRLKFYKDATIPGYMCTMILPGCILDNTEMFFYASAPVPEFTRNCRAYNSTIKVLNCNGSATSVGICGKEGGPNMDLLRLIFDGQSECVDTEAAMYLQHGSDELEAFDDCRLKDSVGPSERHGVRRLRADAKETKKLHFKGSLTGDYLSPMYPATMPSNHCPISAYMLGHGVQIKYGVRTSEPCVIDVYYG
jgi:hypothetical protein